MSELTAGQLAEAANVNVETLRYYERRGLMPEPARRESGYRIYSQESVERLHFIKGAQELGFSLEEIKDLLALRVDQNANSGEVRRRAQDKVDQIDAKIRKLRQMRDALSHLIDLCSDHGPTHECPILEAMELHTFSPERNHAAD